MRTLKHTRQQWADSPSPEDECTEETGHVGPWNCTGEAEDGTTFYRCANCGEEAEG